jgi:hypothetical protein
VAQASSLCRSYFLEDIQMVRRIVLTMVIALIAVYVMYNYLENRAKEERKKAEAKKTEEKIKVSVSEMVKRTNAIDNWEEKLSKGKNIRMAPIMTVELDHLWINDRPILFVGSIKDITSESHDNYIVEIKQTLFNSKYFFGTELLLNLKCSKTKIDSFLRVHPDIFKNYGLINGVAVIAYIKNIETRTFLDKEDETREVKIGKGNLIDILYVGNVLF